MLCACLAAGPGTVLVARPRAHGGRHDLARPDGRGAAGRTVRPADWDAHRRRSSCSARRGSRRAATRRRSRIPWSSGARARSPWTCRDRCCSGADGPGRLAAAGAGDGDASRASCPPVRARLRTARPSRARSSSRAATARLLPLLALLGRGRCCSCAAALVVAPPGHAAHPARSAAGGHGAPPLERWADAGESRAVAAAAATSRCAPSSPRGCPRRTPALDTEDVLRAGARRAARLAARRARRPAALPRRGAVRPRRVPRRRSAWPAGRTSSSRGCCRRRPHELRPPVAPAAPAGARRSGGGGAGAATCRRRGTATSRSRPP